MTAENGSGVYEVGALMAQMFIPPPKINGSTKAECLVVSPNLINTLLAVCCGFSGINSKQMGLTLKRETPNNQFEAIDLLVKTESNLSDALHLLESIMLHSDIDNDKESGGLTSWKQKIMKELMKYGYSWDGDAHEANLLFGESYGVDWS